MTCTDWFDRFGLGKERSDLWHRLADDRVLWDPADSESVKTLRQEVERIARCMDDERQSPPMLWSGIPLETVSREPSSDVQLVVSVGGTNTEFALLRLLKGELYGVDLASGNEVSGPEEILRIRDAVRLPTPSYSAAVPTGRQMLQLIANHMAGHLRPHLGQLLERCNSIFLSWGFAHRVIRTKSRLAGGLSGIVTDMAKNQRRFKQDLLGTDVGELFRSLIAEELGWSRPVAIANDTVMALHYFMSPQWHRFNSKGLFVNGTGSNFALAETYAVRPEGYISQAGEEYQPERVKQDRPLRAGEHAQKFFVNYEIGMLNLGATKTRFDLERKYPLEENVLAGGNAFGQQFRALTQACLSPDLYRQLRDAWAGEGGDASVAPGAAQIGSLASADGSPDAVARIFGSAAVEHQNAADLRLVARAIVNRSAMHAALVLSAVTLRNGFGKGADGEPDLLGMEGSVWRIPGYRDLVQGWWQSLHGAGPLNIEFHAEPTFNASLCGPLYLAAFESPHES